MAAHFHCRGQCVFSLFRRDWRVVMGRFSHRVRARVWALCGLVLLLAGAGLVMSCGRGSFVGRQYDDLTAYYNTFYNANQAFEAGLESVSESEGDIDRTRYLSVFPAPQGAAGESSFEKAIQKSADILREHPNSEWVDDALLLIGRSRYYQQNYVGAAQKFREVIALDAEREGEARFRLAQTLVAADRYSEAAEVLRAGLDQSEDFGHWTTRMRVVRGELYVRQENWAEAERALVRGLEGDLPDDTGARAAFLLGQVRETLEDFEGAEAAYRQVLEYDPAYPLAFAAELSAIEMQGLHGVPERALGRLESLERDDDTREMRAEIARVRARLYRAQGRPDRAKQVLTDVLRGDDSPQGRGEGRTHYELATLYRDTYEDFTRAAAHFDTAATSLSSGRGGETGRDGEPQVLPRAPSDAAAQADRFRGLAGRAQAVARMDSLLRLGRMPPAEFQSVVEEIRQRRLEEQEAQEQRTRQEPRFRGGGRGGVREASAPPSEQGAVQTRETDAGFLFHRDPALVQQGRRQFEQTWGDRPLVDNWRRVEAIRGRQDERTIAEGPEGEPDPQSSAGPSATTRVVDLSAVPRDSASRAKMEDQRAVARYELANALFRAAGRPDSAQTWFRRILDETPEHPVVSQALYGLAQAHRAQGDTTAANDVYRRLIEEHPGTPFARRAREQMGLETTDEEPSREGSQADSAYAQAYEAWRSGAHDTALKKFLAVADAYRETSTAPRALLAAGVVYHRTARDDTSGLGRVRFERYVDSLAQATEPSPLRDTTDESSQRASPSERPRTDSTVSAPARSADTTSSSEPSRVANPPASDTSDADPPKGPPRRVLDSTAVANRESPDSPPDSAGTPSPPSRDTIARVEETPSPDTAGADTTVADTTGAGPPADSVSAAPESKEESADPFEVLLTHLTDQYPETPEAERAQALLTQLREQHAARERAAEDSTAVESTPDRRAEADTVTAASSEDTTAAEDAAQSRGASTDSLARPRRGSSDTTRTGEDPSLPLQHRDSSTTPVRADSSRRPSPPDTSRGGRDGGRPSL